MTENEKKEVLEALKKLSIKFDTKFGLDGISSILRECTKMTINANKKCDMIQEDLNHIKKILDDIGDQLEYV